MPHTPFHIVWGLSKHIAFAYLIYSLFQHQSGRVPTGRTTTFLLLGSLFPDFVDKPLVVFEIIEYGRELGHSLFTATFVIITVRYATRRWNRTEIGTAFGIGYLSHLPVDMYGTVFTGSQPIDTAFLFWPVVVEYSLKIPTPVLPVSRMTVFTVIIACAFSMWVYDRMPIVADIVDMVAGRYRNN